MDGGLDVRGCAGVEIYVLVLAWGGRVLLCEGGLGRLRSKSCDVLVERCGLE